MSSVIRIFRNNQLLTKYICTSSVIKNNNFKGDKDPSVETEEKNAVKQTKEIKKKPEVSNKKTQMKTDSSNPVNEDNFLKIVRNSANEVARNLGGGKEIANELMKLLHAYSYVEEEKKEHVLDVCFNEDVMEGRESRQTIFNKDIMEKPQLKLNIWDDLEMEYLAYQTKKAPTNYFEELMYWTNEGKLWHFPIDNDQGLETEGQTSFTEHIFLDRHLEPWCPRKGPLRRFMELVLIGLSKNPYITVAEKIEHIHWFEEYFERKKKLLQELGATGSVKEISQSSETAES